MSLSIRTKIIGNLLLASALPLTVAIMTILTLGYRQQVRQCGATYRSEALHVAHNLNLIAQHQVTALHDLLTLTDLATHLGEPVAPVSKREIAAMESRWATLPEDSPELQAILNTPAADLLHEFQQQYPFFAELLVTDSAGRLVAATQKTTDYYQADESWWQHASTLSNGLAWVEGLALDKSADVLSLDVCSPIMAQAAPGSPATVVGVAKAVLDVTPLFSSVPVLLSESGATREIVRRDGRVLLHLLDEGFSPRTETIPADAMANVLASSTGWTLAKWGGDDQMVGVAPLRLFGDFAQHKFHTSTPSPWLVLVRNKASSVLAPIRSQVLIVAVAGVLLTLACMWLGIQFSGQHFVKPLEMIRAAARSVAATARTGPADATPSTPTTREHAERVVQRVREMRTGDELETLGQDFAGMANRILHYQEQLEETVAEKTAEIQDDLRMARDFQQALLPRQHPLIEGACCADNLYLDFHHVYRPAAELSGDFFDVIKLDAHRVGILIADVMGHGTRSALVTAILRALLQETAGQAADPGVFLGLLDDAFSTIVREAGQFVFVTAAYMVIDSKERTVSCASAGHPSPIVARRSQGAVEPLFENLRDSPALGIFDERHRQVFSCELKPHEAILLFTDGILEATNFARQEFGQARLSDIIRTHLHQDLASLTRSIVQAVMEFAGSHPLEDDICLVGVEALQHKKADD